MLGECGEARDVDEHERPVHGAIPRLRRVVHPLDQEARHIGLEHLALTLEDRRIEQSHHVRPRISTEAWVVVA
jgi:hypothetical protein